MNENNKYLFTPIPNEFIDDIPNLNKFSPTVYMTLLKHTNYKRDKEYKCNPSLETLIAITGLSQETINKAITSLIENGWIINKVKTPTKSNYPSNTYYLSVTKNINQELIQNEIKTQNLYSISQKKTTPSVAKIKNLAANSGTNYILTTILNNCINHNYLKNYKFTKLNILLINSINLKENENFKNIFFEYLNKSKHKKAISQFTDKLYATTLFKFFDMESAIPDNPNTISFWDKELNDLIKFTDKLTTKLYAFAIKESNKKKYSKHLPAMITQIEKLNFLSILWIATKDNTDETTFSFNSPKSIIQQIKSVGIHQSKTLVIQLVDLIYQQIEQDYISNALPNYELNF